ncbi:hypothetical protein [Rhizobium sp. PP-F2F-G48]|uniref:hypothetical protein n=1 Tax=Rhizobium sp. PP-F2F-G48 TaxID=2135651 RepID=UPI00104490FB|nr:hypothetical protein [Rhizobium sp. PP-F2F-G48]
MGDLFQRGEEDFQGARRQAAHASEFKIEDIGSCEKADIIAYVPKPMRGPAFADETMTNSRLDGFSRRTPPGKGVPGVLPPRKQVRPRSLWMAFLVLSRPSTINPLRGPLRKRAAAPGFAVAVIAAGQGH